MKIAVVHKPYFIPWMGYFAKLLHADVFIIQDNVLLSNRVWVNRTQVIRPDGIPDYVTLPIGECGNMRISDVELSSEARQSSARNISMSIEHAYAKARHFAEWRSIKFEFSNIMARHSRLIDIDITLIETLAECLQLQLPEIRMASTLRQENDPLDNVISVCQETGCDAIILGTGNTDWTEQDSDRLRKADIHTLHYDFLGAHPVYYQTRRERIGFYPGLSILDCILNEGLETAASLTASVPLFKHKGV